MHKYIGKTNIIFGYIFVLSLVRVIYETSMV